LDLYVLSIQVIFELTGVNSLGVNSLALTEFVIEINWLITGF